MRSQCVLVVEDEDDIRELVSYNMVKEGYEVAAAASGEKALEIAAGRNLDLVLLDLLLPGIDGLTVCRKMKADLRTSDVPIIMLTAKGEESDIVAGLNLGADDYITKPFSPRVLIARTRAVLRRLPVGAEVGAVDAHQPGAYGGKPNSKRDGPEQAGSNRTIRIHELVIHPGRHQVVLGEQEVDLTSTEFRVLQFLAAKPGWVFTRQQILDGVHGDNYAITDRAIEVQIVGLRKKLGKGGEYMEAVRGVGCRVRE